MDIHSLSVLSCDVNVIITIIKILSLTVMLFIALFYLPHVGFNRWLLTTHEMIMEFRHLSASLIHVHPRIVV